jgi:hypothetical protein
MEMCRQIDKVLAKDIIHIAQLVFGKASRKPISLVTQEPVEADSYKKVFQDHGIGGV